MNNIAAEVTCLLCSLISTQLQQNLPRYVDVLKLQKEFEETCTSPGRYYICGGAKQEVKTKIIHAWREKYNDKKKDSDKKWEIQDLRVMKYGLGLVGQHSV